MDFDRRVLEETYGDLENYGIAPGPVPGELFGKMGRAVLTIAGADGELSPREMGFVLGFARAAGAPPQAIEAFRTFNYRKANIEDFLDAQTKPLAKVILYQAIRVARADGFAQKERDTAIRGAKKLGLDPTIVQQIEAILALEDGARAARLSVMTPSERWTGVGSYDAALLENDFWRYDQFGSTMLMPPQLAPDIGKAILIIASGDGDLSETERSWSFGMGKAFGVPNEVLEGVMKFDPRGEKLETYLTPAVKPYARVILYDALRCAASDGFTEKERQMTRKAAKLLGVDASIVPWMESVYLMENDVRQARIQLLSPEGGLVRRI